MKKTYLYALIALASVGIMLGVGATAVSAVTNTTVKSQFVALLAKKLGISEDKVSTALDETRTTLRDQREAEVKAKLDAALKDGKITQRQYDIFKAMHEIMQEKMESGDFRGKDVKEDMISLLKNKGLTVTQTELDTLRDTMSDLGLGRGGMGRGMGMMRR